MTRKKTSERKSTNKKTDWEFYFQVGAIIVLSLVLIYSYSEKNNVGGGIGTVSASSVIPQGIPPVYGDELGISYNDVSPSNPQKADETIKLLGNIDKLETLKGEELKRYINMLYYKNNGISCEYCCGARSVIFENGQPACGCAHSYAMRGLTKYLIKYYGDKLTDEEILTEIGKWKVLFFPEILEGKSKIMENYGIKNDYVNLTSNKYRGIEQGQVNGGMIGAC